METQPDLIHPCDLDLNLDEIASEVRTINPSLSEAIAHDVAHGGDAEVEQIDLANGNSDASGAASGFAAAGLAPLNGSQTDALPARRGRAAAGAPHPFAPSPLRHLVFAIRETSSADSSPESGRQYLRDTFGQGYWSQRERFIVLLEWLAALGNAEGMNEWISDPEAARTRIVFIRFVGTHAEYDKIDAITI